jgi:4-amino-4-deoxy-L-arabinose transferase-like glycosyltransferase
LAAALLFAVTVLLGGLAVGWTSPLSWAEEEHYQLGVNLYATGQMRLCEGASPVSRPPGYPVFVALALFLSGGREAAVAAAQVLLLGASALIFFWWACGLFGRALALPLALVYACNPLMLVLCGYRHYDILHLSVVAGGGFALQRALTKPKPRWMAMTGAGALFGIATLIRPMTLILPATLLPFLWLAQHLEWRRTIRTALALTLGLVAVVGPYTLRNYALTGRIIPVNKQDGQAFWILTARPFRASDGDDRWKIVWFSRGMPIFTAVTGETHFTMDAFARNHIPVDDALLREAGARLRQEPWVAVYNVWENLRLFILTSPAAIVERFVYEQLPGDPAAPRKGAPRALALLLSEAFDVLVLALTLAAAIGAYVAARKREGSLWVPLGVLTCFVVSHSLSFASVHYVYIKLPFLILLAGYLAQDLEEASLRLPLLGSFSVGRALATGAAVLALVLSVALLAAGPILR